MFILPNLTGTIQKQKLTAVFNILGADGTRIIMYNHRANTILTYSTN